MWNPAKGKCQIVVVERDRCILGQTIIKRSLLVKIRENIYNVSDSNFCTMLSALKGEKFYSTILVWNAHKTLLQFHMGKVLSVLYKKRLINIVSRDQNVKVKIRKKRLSDKKL